MTVRYRPFVERSMGMLDLPLLLLPSHIPISRNENREASEPQAETRQRSLQVHRTDEKIVVAGEELEALEQDAGRAASVADGIGAEVAGVQLQRHNQRLDRVDVHAIGEVDAVAGLVIVVAHAHADTGEELNQLGLGEAIRHFGGAEKQVVIPAGSDVLVKDIAVDLQSEPAIGIEEGPAAETV